MFSYKSQKDDLASTDLHANFQQLSNNVETESPRTLESVGSSYYDDEFLHRTDAAGSNFLDKTVFGLHSPPYSSIFSN